MEVEDQADLASWVEEFDLTHPVGGDYDWRVWDAFHLTDGRPQYAVIDTDFVLIHVGTNRVEAEEIAAGLL